MVGSLPTTNGMSATAKAGCLLVLDRWGHVRETLSGNGINGPWDMTAISNHHFAQLFVTNVLNGTVAANGSVVNKGTVLRLTLALHRHHAPHLLRNDDDRVRIRAAHRPGRPGRRAHRRGAELPRHPVRRGQPG